jgi:hypothetical protein
MNVEPSCFYPNTFPFIYFILQSYEGSQYACNNAWYSISKLESCSKLYGECDPNTCHYERIW